MPQDLCTRFCQYSQYPEVTIQPKEVFINESESFELICTAKGMPTPTVYWNTTAFGGNFSLETEERVTLMESDNETSPQDKMSAVLVNRLKIRNVHRSNIGFLSCVVENVVGRVVGKSFVQLLQ
ncbi:BDNF/NT-3 growth factors receptor-like protein [Leptotrombidium deliense]|uniref:BDNF/NT-3 growth factors receptor-like protein n=1 Tax=Leptotrombidium deliense TaxID=299467 RepID=A0A443SKB3_9ACAR|nr:BDNF/NT-3 growth factors receptor-like protein [Leptotrombidium deliense]